MGYCYKQIVNHFLHLDYAVPIIRFIETSLTR